jgi:pyruvate kinase
MLLADPSHARGQRTRSRSRIGIIASVGPTSADPKVVRQLSAAGAEIFRINMAHQDARSTRSTSRAIRRGSSKHVPLLADLAGGKIRTGQLRPGAERIPLHEGAPFTLRIGRGWIGQQRRSDGSGTWLSYDAPRGASLRDHVAVGNQIWLHQGKIVLKVTGVERRAIQTQVVKGGELRQRASVHIIGQDPPFPEITREDRKKLAIAVRNGATHIGVSMVQRPSQLQAVRKELKRLGAPHVKLVAKIETIPAYRENLEALVRDADAVMIARGDLGVALAGNLRDLHQAERTIARACRRHNRPVIDATGFMSNLRKHDMPSRKNLADVAHARRHVRPDYIMLKGTAINRDPVAPVHALRAALEGCGSREKAPR